MGDVRQVLVPDIGDFKDVPVIELQVKPGTGSRWKRRSSRLNPIRHRWKCHPRMRAYEATDADGVEIVDVSGLCTE